MTRGINPKVIVYDEANWDNMDIIVTHKPLMFTVSYPANEKIVPSRSKKNCNTIAKILKKIWSWFNEI
jgi:hypothetical protein